MAAMSRSKRGFLSVLNNSLNRLTRRLARRSIGPFSLVRNVGRKSGTVYETPVILAKVPDGFVAELTYGSEVQWYRNIVAAGRCEVVFRGEDYVVTTIQPYPVEPGRAAFGFPAATLLRMLRRKEFRLLRSDLQPIDRGEPSGT
jgi:deazaflavin-dependent oxidoreductase (nitroreductase family)